MVSFGIQTELKTVLQKLILLQKIQ